MSNYQKMPWVIWNEIRRWLITPGMRIYFYLNGIPWGKGWRILGAPVLQRFKGSSIVLGDDLTLRSWVASNPLAPNHPVVLSTRSERAVLEIGEGCGITGGSLVAAERIQIGNRVWIGSNCTIVDTDFHPLSREQRNQDPTQGETSPVVIEDDVFIGMNVLILKGSLIGQGSVIGAGSVVAGKIPPGVVAAGNPARVIRDHVDGSGAE